MAGVWGQLAPAGAKIQKVVVCTSTFVGPSQHFGPEGSLIVSMQSRLTCMMELYEQAESKFVMLQDKCSYLEVGNQGIVLFVGDWVPCIQDFRQKIIENREDHTIFVYTSA